MVKESSKPDERFNFSSNPRFKKTPQDVKKIKVDKRFEKMFSSSKFNDEGISSKKGGMDKYGRIMIQNEDGNDAQKGKKKGSNTTTSKSKMKEFYQLEDDEVEEGSDDDDADGDLDEKIATGKLEVDQWQSKDSNLDEVSTKEVSESTTVVKNNKTKSKSKDQTKEKLLVSDDDNDDDKSDADKSEKDDDENDNPDEIDTDFSDSSEDPDDEEAYELAKKREAELWEDEDEKNCTRIDGDEGMTGTRLAIQNLDWQNIDSEDVYVVACSFADPNFTVQNNGVDVKNSKIGKKLMKKGKGYYDGESDSESNESKDKTDKKGNVNRNKVKKVTIYLSDIGKQIRDREAIHGPDFKKYLTFDKKTGQIDPDTIRKFNASRGSHYFAIIECDNKKTAELLYQELDGNNIDALADGRPLDVRVVPDDIDFRYHKDPDTGEMLVANNEDKNDSDEGDDKKLNSNSNNFIPRIIHSQSTKVSRNYQGVFEGRLKSGRSHTHHGGTEIEVDWDETPGGNKRKRDLTYKKFTRKEMEQLDFDTYLASSSEEEEDSSSKKKSIMEKRKLLLGEDYEDGGKGGSSDSDTDSDSSDSKDSDDSDSDSSDSAESLKTKAEKEDSESDADLDKKKDSKVPKSKSKSDAKKEKDSSKSKSKSLSQSKSKADNLKEDSDSDSDVDSTSDSDSEDEFDKIGEMEMTYNADADQKAKELKDKVQTVNTTGDDDEKKKLLKSDIKNVKSRSLKDVRREEEEQKSNAWSRYQMKRKEKIREKKQARKDKAKEIKEITKKELQSVDEGIKGGKGKNKKNSSVTVKYEGEMDLLKSSDGFKNGANTNDKDNNLQFSSEQERANLELLTMDLNDNNAVNGTHGNIDDRSFDVRVHGRGQSRKKKVASTSNQTGTGSEFEVNLKDSRFQKLLTNKDFSIDPTRPEYSRTKEMDKVLAAKRKAKLGLDNDQSILDNCDQSNIKILAKKRKKVSSKS